METVAQQRAGAQRSGTSPLYQVLAEDIVAMGVEAVFGLISDVPLYSLQRWTLLGHGSTAHDTRTAP